MAHAEEPQVAAASELIHATAIALDGSAVLIRGPSGSGKSDLALRCLAAGPSPLWAGEVRLIADDRVVITRQGDRLLAAAPSSIRGKIEVRGIGILPVEPLDTATVCLIADLATPIERLPALALREELLGIRLPALRFAPFEPSAHIKLLLALSVRP
jgi:serine kinase of HPr protein (carbohydrate metabolism regulator)